MPPKVRISKEDILAAEKFHYVYSCDLDINVQLKM